MDSNKGEDCLDCNEEFCSIKRQRIEPGRKLPLHHNSKQHALQIMPAEGYEAFILDLSWTWKPTDS